ncbi:MAG: three-Cys-motif partner protein TcmP [Verrucomicrobiales bacterium]|jgi:three-Cys-motif partner protein|nr:three-Cys-motif partner protein TcmP [Verrucomicrobiales bacterium]
MSKKLDTIWEAEPHTIIKIDILKSYVDAWFPILATSFPKPILYVDGFAGPGYYTNHLTGSPLAALQSIKNTLVRDNIKIISPKITCAFIEKDKDRFNVLESVLEEYRKEKKLEIKTFNTSFDEGMQQLETEYPDSFNGKDPIFVFADPFGGTGISFSTFKRCMEGTSCELLINLDTDGVARIFQARNNKWEEQLTSLFGEECWRDKLSEGTDTNTLKIQILDLYKECLRKIPGVDYIWHFTMRGKQDSLNYNLVFATKHHRGLEKMKEAMKAVDITGNYSFSDAHMGQRYMFRNDDGEIYAEAAYKKFCDQSLSMDEMKKYALNETPFLNSKAILRKLDDDGKVEITPIPGEKIKKGSFPEDKILKIRFVTVCSKLKQTSFFLNYAQQNPHRMD